MQRIHRHDDGDTGRRRLEVDDREELVRFDTGDEIDE